MKIINITEIIEENKLLKEINKNLESENEKLLNYSYILESQKND